MSHKRNPELEAKIIAAPDDFTSYVVYADWLIEQGDPRGELIGLQRMKKPSAKALLAEHAEHFLGGMRDFEDLITPVEWHMGFIRSARVANTPERHDERPDDYEKDIFDAIEALLSHPSSVFLRQLDVGILDVEGNDYTKFFQILGQHPKLMLEKLFVGDFGSEETELNWSTIGATLPLWAAAPNLRELTLRSGAMDLTGITAPKLTKLEIITGELNRTSLQALVAADWPELETLDLQLGRLVVPTDDFAPLYDGARFPKLKKLALANSSMSDDIAMTIVDAKILRQLDVLDLRMGTLGGDGADALANAAPRLAHLKTLDVSENWLNAAASTRLAGICAQVFSSGQQDDGGDPDNRYIAAYE